VAALMPQTLKEAFMKLSDAQRQVLSSALQRKDRAVLLPANLKGSAAKKVIDRLLNDKFLQELRAKNDMPVWRRDDGNRPFTLRITNAGLRALEVEHAAEEPDKDAAAGPHVVAAAPEVPPEQPSRAKQSEAEKNVVASAKATKALSDQVKPDSKHDRIVALLQRPQGATLDVLVEETQWQKHSVRGFLAGTVRKKLNLPLLSEKLDGVRSYRIVTAKAAKAKTKASRKV
jgi:hypothetical protein